MILKKKFECGRDRDLRKEWLKNDLSPYVPVTSKFNCGGRGLCATCGVFIKADSVPSHWHDKLARAFSYPRLRCQITIDKDMEVKIPSKIIWGRKKV